ncbi:hypothetical protein GF407_03185 [candidate division KSB1 bacterium]|nr:hypothetical protein [candidate division KSB1 bacterium]
MRFILLLLCLVTALFINSCSYCEYVPKESYLTIDPEQKIHLEIHTIDGVEYVTRNFSFINDSLVIYMDSKRQKNEAKIISVESIKTIKYCEFSTNKARKSGLIFTTITLLVQIIVLTAPLKMGTIGG